MTYAAMTKDEAQRSIRAFYVAVRNGLQRDRGLQYLGKFMITEVKGMSVDVKAPMPGKILEVLVNVGDQVKEDDEVIMLEAMKMENSIYAPADGTVKEIRVKANDSVDTEQLMMVIE